MSRMMVFFVAVSACAGCNDAPPSIRLIIDQELEAEWQFDRIEFTATASRTAEGALCDPIRRTFGLDDLDDLPLIVALEAGEIYDEWVLFRLEAYRAGEESSEPFFTYQQRLVWPTEGFVDCRVTVADGCGESECPAGRQCVDGRCEDIPLPDALEDPAIRDDGISCWAEADGPS